MRQFIQRRKEGSIDPPQSEYLEENNSVASTAVIITIFKTIFESCGKSDETRRWIDSWSQMKMCPSFYALKFSFTLERIYLVYS